MHSPLCPSAGYPVRAGNRIMRHGQATTAQGLAVAVLGAWGLKLPFPSLSYLALPFLPLPDCLLAEIVFDF